MTTKRKPKPEPPKGQVWTSEQFGQEFEILGLMISPTIVRRKSDGMRGTIQFHGDPRIFFDFRPEPKQ